MPIFTYSKYLKTINKKITLIRSRQYSIHVALVKNETEVTFTLKIDTHKRITQWLKYEIIWTFTVIKYKSKKKNLPNQRLTLKFKKNSIIYNRKIN